MQLLPTINAPSSGWTGPVSLVGLKLNQISGLVIALNGASPGDSFAFFFSQNGGLSPAVTGLIELATPTQIQLVNTSLSKLMDGEPPRSRYPPAG